MNSEFKDRVASDVEAIDSNNSNKGIMYSLNDMTYQSPLSDRYSVKFFNKIWGKKLILSATEVARLDASDSDKISILLSKVKDEAAILWAIECVKNSVCHVNMARAEFGVEVDSRFDRALWALSSTVACGSDHPGLSRIREDCARFKAEEGDYESSCIAGAVNDLFIAVRRLREDVEVEGDGADDTIVEMAENAAALAMFSDEEERWQLNLLVKMAGGQV